MLSSLPNLITVKIRQARAGEKQIKGPFFKTLANFQDFLPLPPPVGSFLLLSAGKFGQFLTPSSLKNADVLNGWSQSWVEVISLSSDSHVFIDKESYYHKKSATWAGKEQRLVVTWKVHYLQSLASRAFIVLIGSRCLGWEYCAQQGECQSLSHVRNNILQVVWFLGKNFPSLYPPS